MQDLAAQYKHVKFLTIPSTECIPNYPDENLPTLLVYHDGQCKRTIVGTKTLGYDRISPESEQSHDSAHTNSSASPHFPSRHWHSFAVGVRLLQLQPGKGGLTCRHERRVELELQIIRHNAGGCVNALACMQVWQQA